MLRAPAPIARTALAASAHSRAPNVPRPARQLWLLDHGGVAWLIDTDLATSWQSNLGHRSPPRFVHVRALDTSRGQPLHLGVEIAAHEVQVTSARLCRMDRKFGRRQASRRSASLLPHRWNRSRTPQRGTHDQRPRRCCRALRARRRPSAHLAHPSKGNATAAPDHRAASDMARARGSRCLRSGPADRAREARSCGILDSCCDAILLVSPDVHVCERMTKGF
jgi:hypothetical protein